MEPWVSWVFLIMTVTLVALIIAQLAWPGRNQHEALSTLGLSLLLLLVLTVAAFVGRIGR